MLYILFHHNPREHMWDVFFVLFCHSPTLPQAIRMLIAASTELQKEIVESGRVSHPVLNLNPKEEDYYFLLNLM